MMQLVVLWLLWAVAPGWAQAPEDLCATPRDAAASLVDYQQAETMDLALAATCLDVPAALEPKRTELAQKLKQILDARGLYVPTGELTTDPDHKDSSGAHRLIVIAELPQIYLERKQGQWLYSRDTIKAIPELHRKTFSPVQRWLIDVLPDVFQSEVFGLKLWQYVYFVLLVLASLGVGQLSQSLLSRQVVRVARRLGLRADRLMIRRIRGPLTWFATGLVFRVGITDLQLGVSASFFLKFLATSVLSLSVVIIVTRIIDVVADLFEKRAALTESKLDDQVIPLLTRAIKSGVWALGVVFILQNLGVEVTALLAGVSVGGVAVALAAQDTISNLFGSLTIFTDRPFQIGDWVIIDGSTEGVVEEVGFRSTRIRTFGKSVISVPNAKVANSTVDNMGQRTHRRLRLDFGLRYDTTPAQMRAFLAQVEQMLRARDTIWKETVEVRFTNFGDSALEVMVYTFFDVPDWSTELSEKQEVLLRIMEIAQEVGVDFAFPSVSLYQEPTP